MYASRKNDEEISIHKTKSINHDFFLSILPCLLMVSQDSLEIR